MAMPAPWRFWVRDGRSATPEIIHHDERLLIVDKPPGMLTTAPTPTEPCLVNWVRERFPTLHPHATSRLDSQVSGLVTFALDSEVNRHLLDARDAGTYERIYLGITLCPLTVGRMEWSWPLSIDPTNPHRRVARPGRGERDALTLVEVAARAPGATLLRLRPKTGRTHQLRVHAAEAGAPLFGDSLYQAPRRQVLPDGTVVSARRVMLHCARVSFPGYASDTRVQVEAPVGPDMVSVWRALGGDAVDLQP
jgi:23S rRNA pseudouridine1911/1915/1917 synthase